MAQWIERWPTNKGRRFDSQSGHTPELPARSPVGGERTEISVFFLLFFSLPLALKLNKIFGGGREAVLLKIKNKNVGDI